MNILHAWRLLLGGASTVHADKPTTPTMLIAYVIPLSLVTPIMLALVVPQHPAVFKDLLPGHRVYIVSFILFLLQLAAVPTMALIAKHTAEMVDIRPSFQDAFLLMALSATPLWLASLFYVIPSFSLNITLHCVAALIASALVYHGIRTIFQLERRGARIMLTIALVAIASIAFGVVLVATLMLWEHVQQLQLAVH